MRRINVVVLLAVVPALPSGGSGEPAGGACLDDARGSREPCRESIDPGEVCALVGFRVSRTLDCVWEPQHLIDGNWNHVPVDAGMSDVVSVGAGGALRGSG